MRRILVLAVIWGWSFFFIKVAVQGMTPPTMACLRCALGAVALVALCRAKRWRLPRDRTTWRHFAVMGFIYSALPFSLLGWGEQRTTSALAAVAQADTPLFAALFSVALLGQHLKRIHVVGLAVGFVGVGICAGIAGGDLAHSSTAGALAEVASGASYGLAFCYARRYLGGVAPVVAATGQVIAGALIALPFAVATSVRAGIQLTPTRIGAIVVLGILGTGVAYAVNYASIADVGATKASLVTYLIPIVAVAVGIAVLGEPFQLRVILGGSVIVMGIALVQDRIGGLRRSLVRVPVVGVVLASVLLGACASSSDPSTISAGCANPHHDPLDPTSVVHVLPGAPAPRYLRDPPTSGAHQVAVLSQFQGARSEPISRPQQVGLLEKGQVVVQYRPSPGAAEALASLTADARVTLAPAPDLGPAVAATAWTWGIECSTTSATSASALRRFITTHAGHGPDEAPHS